MVSRYLPFFKYRVDPFKNNADRIRAHRFHGLTHGGEWRGTKSRGGNIVETNHGAVLGHAQPGLSQGANSTVGGHIVEGEQRGEGALLLEQMLGQPLTCLKAGKWIAGLGQ